MSSEYPLSLWKTVFQGSLLCHFSFVHSSHVSLFDVDDCRFYLHEVQFTSFLDHDLSRDDTNQLSKIPPANPVDSLIRVYAHPLSHLLRHRMHSVILFSPVERDTPGILTLSLSSHCNMFFYPGHYSPEDDSDRSDRLLRRSAGIPLLSLLSPTLFSGLLPNNDLSDGLFVSLHWNDHLRNVESSRGSSCYEGSLSHPSHDGSFFSVLSVV